MSELLSSYLEELLKASSCSEMIFVQDNCKGPKDFLSLLVDSDASVDKKEERNFHSFSSLPELSRWNSSSPASATQKTENDSKSKCLRPPRRQISLDNGEWESLQSSSSTDLSMNFQTAFPSNAPSQLMNNPPRPPPRRTSSRLKRIMLRALETDLDRFPLEEIDSSSSSSSSSTSSFVQDSSVPRTQKISPVASIPASPDCVIQELENSMMPRNRRRRCRRPTKGVLNIKNRDLDQDSSSSSSSSSSSRMHAFSKTGEQHPTTKRSSERAAADSSTPRLPRRQLTSELVRLSHDGSKNKGNNNNNTSKDDEPAKGDSLYDFLVVKRTKNL